jgi:hypothetical protein
MMNDECFFHKIRTHGSAVRFTGVERRCARQCQRTFHMHMANKTCLDVFAKSLHVSHASSKNAKLKIDLKYFLGVLSVLRKNP